MIKACKRCGRLIGDVQRATLYCVACKEIIDAEQAEQRRKRQRLKYARTAHPLKRTGETIAQINAKARALGLTYGEYMAREASGE